MKRKLNTICINILQQFNQIIVKNKFDISTENSNDYECISQFREIIRMKNSKSFSTSNRANRSDTREIVSDRRLVSLIVPSLHPRYPSRG